jgi:hypothetical protein
LAATLKAVINGNQRRPKSAEAENCMSTAGGQRIAGGSSAPFAKLRSRHGK